MPTATACPDRALLERFALGRLAPIDTDEVAGHVEQCESCARTLDAFSGSDTLIEALAGRTPDPNAPRGQAVDGHADGLVVDGLIERLKAIPAPEPEARDVNLHDLLAPAGAPDEIGRLGIYRVRGLLGSGGMGVVLLADDPDLRRPVALKIMKPALAASETARRRFLREARAMAAVRHDNVAVIYAVGEDRGLPFFAMELLEGESLADRLRRAPKLTLHETIDIGIQVAAGLTAAHERGVVHRDIKPGNLWLQAGAGSPRVKILDFGLARGSDEDIELTDTDCLVGTPAYMAPEQIDNKGVGPHSDLFSVGCVLYRLAAGRAPFPGETAMARLRAVADHRPPAPHQVDPTVPRALSDLIMRLLAKDPGQRPSSAREVGESLRVVGIQLASPPAPPRQRVLAVVLLAFVAILLFASVTITLRTRDGTLVVKVPETGVKVLIDGDEKIVLESSKSGTIELRPGPHRLIVKRGDEQLFVSDHFILKSGETTVVEADWKPVAAPAGKTRALATPLDRLDARSIPADRQYAGQPPELVAVLGSKGDDNRALTFSEDGRWLLSVARHDPSLARLWNLESCKQEKVFPGPAGEMSALAFGPGARTFLSGGAHQQMLFWDVDAARPLRPFLGPGDCVYSVAFAPDGRSVLAGDRSGHALPGSVWWFDSATGKVKQQLKGHLYHVSPVLFFPDGRRALSGSHFADPTLRVWDLEEGKELRRFDQPDGVGAAAVSADGRWIAGGSTRVRVWDLDKATDEPAFEWKDDIPGVAGIGLGPDARTLTWIDTAGLVTRRDLRTGQVLLKTKLPSPPRSAAFAADRRHLAAGGVDGMIYILRLESLANPAATAP